MENQQLNQLDKVLLLLSFSLLVTGGVLGYLDAYQLSGILVLIGLLLLVYTFYKIERLNSYVFTIVILLAAVSAMYYPHWYTRIFDYELKNLIVPILMVIMFGMGTSMQLKDFYNVIKMPRGVLVGLICQFSIMPIIGFALASLSNLPPEIAAGIILVGCSPSGLASNVMSYIAKANLALSLTLTMLATLIAPLVTPFLMKLLADQLVPIDFYAMFLSIVKIVILPIIVGLIFNRIFRNQRYFIDKILPLVSMAGIALVITIITAAGRDSLLQIGVQLIFIVLIHNALGYLLGYWAGALAGLDLQSRRTIALEVGMQNSGLASGIAMEVGKVASMGLAPAIFGPLMNITGSSLASYWAGKEEETSVR